MGKIILFSTDFIEKRKWETEINKTAYLPQTFFSCKPLSKTYYRKKPGINQQSRILIQPRTLTPQLRPLINTREEILWATRSRDRKNSTIILNNYAKKYLTIK